MIDKDQNMVSTGRVKCKCQKNKNGLTVFTIWVTKCTGKQKANKVSGVR